MPRDRKLGKCCEGMVAAMRYGYVEINPLDAGELILARRKLTDVDPNSKAGNVLTGETYDPARFQVSFALAWCPFCGEPLTLDAKYEREEGRRR